VGGETVKRRVGRGTGESRGIGFIEGVREVSKERAAPEEGGQKGWGNLFGLLLCVVCGLSIQCWNVRR